MLHPEPVFHPRTISLAADRRPVLAGRVAERCSQAADISHRSGDLFRRPMAVPRVNPAKRDGTSFADSVDDPSGFGRVRPPSGCPLKRLPPVTVTSGHTALDSRRR